MTRLIGLLIALTLLTLPTQVKAQKTEVDLELVLLVDVSRSMSANELEIQRRGYAAALRSDAVFAAIRSGLLQNVAITYIEWAGTQEIIVDWQVLKTRADLDAFAAKLTARFDPALRRTSISEALIFGAKRIQNNTISGLRRVIDISGDGPNNVGRPVLLAREAVLGQGIVINGLPLLTREGMGAQWHLDDLDIYYKTCVIGGPGSFVIPVLDWTDFANAVRRKLVLEIANLAPIQQMPQPNVIPAQFIERDPTDCLIGEKIWQDLRRNYFFEP